MSKKKKNTARAEPAKTRSVVWLTDSAGFDSLECKGYTSLAHSPEVMTAVDTIARLVGAMTIYLMRNTDQGQGRTLSRGLCARCTSRGMEMPLYGLALRAAI